MEDALKIGFTRSRKLISRFLKKINRLLCPVDYDKWHPIAGSASIRLRPAGHVLGSTIFEVKLPSGEVVVFTGDIGTGNDPLLRKPTSPPAADLLVLESTYGDKIHDASKNRQQALEDVLRRTLQDRGVTIIPAFSLGRTQAILYEMNGIFERLQEESGNSLLKQVDVIVDSPLASRFTELYKSMKDYWGREAQHLMQTDDQPLVFENLTTVNSHREHKDTLAYLDKQKLPAIVIAGSGMCTGGRVLNYLKRFIANPTTDLVFVGYQASGTPGHLISRGCDWVRLNGRKYDVGATVHQMQGYSAHGDQSDLIGFVQNMANRPKRIRLVHGDYQPKLILTEKLTSLGYQVI
jgi:metallo-beta-lactamase family protein